jgi:stalled ribosome alternative rescue factor ArfA
MAKKPQPPKVRSVAAHALADPQNRQQVIKPKKGKGAYVRRKKAGGADAETTPE